MAWLTDAVISGVIFDLTHQAGSSIFELKSERPGNHSQMQTKRYSTCASGDRGWDESTAAGEKGGRRRLAHVR